MKLVRFGAAGAEKPGIVDADGGRVGRPQFLAGWKLPRRRQGARTCRASQQRKQQGKGPSEAWDSHCEISV